MSAPERGSRDDSGHEYAQRMKYEYWFITLPVPGPRKKGVSVEDQATLEVNELASRGWEVVNATRPEVIGAIGFMLRREKTQ